MLLQFEFPNFWLKQLTALNVKVRLSENFPLGEKLDCFVGKHRQRCRKEFES